MPTPVLDSLLGRGREAEEPVFLLVRRRVPSLGERLTSLGSSGSSVSFLLVVALVLGTGHLLLWLLFR